MMSVCSFLCLPKETNQRKGTQGTCPAEGGIPCAPRCCRGFANSANASDSANPLFGSLSGARRRANGSLFSPFVLPRLADGGGKRRGNCLRAKPEFFRVPPSARSKGSPQGQDWLGCLFLVSSFGHAKEEKGNSKKASSLSPEFPEEPKRSSLSPRGRGLGRGGTCRCDAVGNFTHPQPPPVKGGSLKAKFQPDITGSNREIEEK